MNSPHDSKRSSPDDLSNTSNKGDVELTEDQLTNASGGLHDISITKPVDKADPKLL